jgi:nitroimidazol reductase NimA-like FMN-containing flavoprotein (pyridoxamine 5'-phosphate oxidase superfamily)
MTVRTWMRDIGAEQCEAHLAGSVLGRLAVIVDGRPGIFPINHVFDPVTRCVAFPTNARTKLHAALGWPSVAYEVDGIEPEDAGGWSVVVVGRAEEITDPAEIARVEGLRHVLWRTEDAVHWIRIVPTQVTGRRIGAMRQ